MKDIMASDIEKMNEEELRKQCLDYYWGIAKLNGYWGNEVWRLQEQIKKLEIEILKHIKEK